MPSLRRGTRFLHRSWRVEGHRPLECVVTRIEKGVVYWRPATGGKPLYFPLSAADRFVGSIIDKEPAGD